MLGKPGFPCIRSLLPPGTWNHPTVPENARTFHTIGPLRVYLDGPYVFVEDQEVPVTAVEVRLIAYLIAHRDQICSRAELLREVWGYEAGTETRTINATIGRLRGKLGPAGALIESVPGRGYRITG
jgi:two-component system phosphate regulon response regulator PhoB